MYSRFTKDISRSVSSAKHVSTSLSALSLVTSKKSPFSTDKQQNPNLNLSIHHATKMTGSEAFVETLLSHNVENVFGIVGSAFMDALDLFPEAGIRFIPVQHEQNAAHMADGYSRISGKHGVCIAQNGPGITNFVTAIAAAYWAHSPVVAITPESSSLTKGLGGFQETEQISIFKNITKYQGIINHSLRIPEITSRAFDYALYQRGPTQINIPRDYFFDEHIYNIPIPKTINYPCGNFESITNTIELLKNSKNPCILAGGGCMIAGKECIDLITKLSNYLSIPVATTYLHNDCYPSNELLSVGPLGYQGFKSAMNCISKSDLILVIGSRLNPFSTLPQYNFEYWPNKKKNNNCKIIQIDIDSNQLGLTTDCDIYIHGDCKQVTEQIFNGVRSENKNGFKCMENEKQRLNDIKKYKEEWEQLLNEWTFKQNEYERDSKIRPRAALRELEKAMPSNAMVATDIGNICSLANSYLRFDNKLPSFLAAMSFGNCQYSFGTALGAKIANPNRPSIAYVGDGAWGMSLNELLTCIRESIPVTVVVFNNNQWGAEKKNQVLWYGDRYIGVNLNNPWSYAEIAKAMCAEGIQCRYLDEIGDALKLAVDNQMNKNKTTVIEIMCTRELGDPFRRDAMKLPKRYLDKYKNTIQVKESETGQPIDL